MGIDWVKMKVSKDIDSKEVDRLICQQKKSFPLTMLPQDLGILKSRIYSLNKDEEQLRLQRYTEAQNALSNLLELPNLDDCWNPITSDLQILSNEVRDAQIIRVYVITYNPLFPLEWRLEAYASFLPKQFSSRLKKWCDYIDDIKVGRYQGYLYDLFSYINYQNCDLQETVKELRQNIQDSYYRSNEWVKKDKFLEMREKLSSCEIFNNKISFFSWLDYPKFSSTLKYSKINDIQVIEWERFLVYRQHICESIKLWNRCVPSKWKIQYPHLPYPDFASFLNEANDNWLHCFFQWCQYLVEEDCGLFMWG